MLHSMTDGDSNGARLVGPPHQPLVDRPGLGGTHLSAPLHRPLGPSRRLRVAPPHKIPGRPICDVDQLKVGYTPPNLATCVDDLGRPSKVVLMTVYPRVEEWEAHGSLTWHPLYSPINRGCIHPLRCVCFQVSSSFPVVSVSVSLVWELELSRAKLGVSGVIFWRVWYSSLPFLL